MRKTLFALGLLCTAGLPFASSAATVSTDSWDILVTEDSDQRLIFSIEPIQMSANEESDDAPTVDVTNPEPTEEEVVTPTFMEGVEGEILINEFVSDPLTGEDEWVELYNPEGRAVDMAGWTIREGSGRTTELEGLLGPDNYLVQYQISGSLNNGGDLIELVDPFGTVIDSVAYGSWDGSSADAAADPNSLGRNQSLSSAFVVMGPTPGSQNTYPDVSAANTEEEETSTDEDTPTVPEADNDIEETNDYDPDLLDADDQSGSVTCTQGNTDTPSDEAETADEDATINASIAELRSLALGSRVTTQGSVAVVPGILGSQYFYLSNGAGVQVYLYSADFPSLTRGTQVRVTGELTEANGELRVKMGDASDLVVLAQGDAPEATDVTGGQIGESTEGWLVRMTGEVTDTSSGELMLTDDEADVRVVIKDATNIIADYEVGDLYTITGIVSETRSGYRVLPRDQDDLLPRTEEASAEDALNGVAGSLASNGSGTGGGWAISIVSVLAFAGAGGRYLFTHKKWLFA